MDLFHSPVIRVIVMVITTGHFVRSEQRNWNCYSNSTIPALVTLF